MKRLLVCLLGLAAVSCDPFPNYSEDPPLSKRTPVPTVARATPTPPPKPGAWMYEKRPNPLDPPK
jgi:hypothetical protein